MLILVSGANKTVEKYSPPHPFGPYLGRLTSPRAGNRVGYDGLPWAADNDAFSATGFDADAYMRMLKRLPSGGLFVTAPDVVGDHDATLELWKQWAPIVRQYQRPAFVLQDGCEAIPPDADAIFIGGSTEFKLSQNVARLVTLAKQRGAWVHMGRVNSRRRIFYAGAIGIDSTDGTATSIAPEVKLPKYLKWAMTTSLQGNLF